MSTHQFPITAPQVSKFIQNMSGVSSNAFQSLGLPLTYLLAEYLRQDRPRPLQFAVMRMVFGLPARPDLGVANVEWTKVVPAKRLSDFAVRPGWQKQMWTQVVQLFPEDLGLVSDEVVPAQVLDRALEWGFQLIPPEAFTALSTHCFGGRVKSGDAMAYLDVNDQGTNNRAVRLINYAEGHGFQVGATMERRPSQDLPENWSILVAAETIEAK